jgi:hypothetical protein
MEWWEVLGMWTTIINNLNKVNKKTKKNNNYENYKDGKIEYSKVSDFVKKDNVSDYTKMMREKILKGEY